MLPSTAKITWLLHAWNQGDKLALNQIMAKVYDKLVSISRSQLKRFPRFLHTHDVVHEAFLEIAKKRNVSWRSSEHFYFLATRTIRFVLITQYRRSLTQKRFGRDVSLSMVSHSQEEIMELHEMENMLAVDGALSKLAQRDEKMAKLVEMRVYAGFTITEVAKVLNMSEATVKRKWSFAITWLSSHLGK